MCDLEECLGEDDHKIQKWIANGWLRDRLQGTRSHDGNGHDIHRFREKDILAFIKRHPEEINLGKVDQVWFLERLCFCVAWICIGSMRNAAFTMAGMGEAPYVSLKGEAGIQPVYALQVNQPWPAVHRTYSTPFAVRRIVWPEASSSSGPTTPCTVIVLSLPLVVSESREPSFAPPFEGVG